MLWRVGEDLLDHAPDVPAALLGRDVMLDLIREQYCADLVVVANGIKGQDGGRFRGRFPLAAALGAEPARGAHVHQQHDDHLALFAEQLHIGPTETGRYFPIDGF